jgi:hypothetical protein
MPALLILFFLGTNLLYSHSCHPIKIFDQGNFFRHEGKVPNFENLKILFHCLVCLIMEVLCEQFNNNTSVPSFHTPIPTLQKACKVYCNVNFSDIQTNFDCQKHLESTFSLDLVLFANLTRQFHKFGFHRDLVTQLTFTLSNDLVTVSNNCKVVLVEYLPQTTYVDRDEITGWFLICNFPFLLRIYHLVSLFGLELVRLKLSQFEYFYFLNDIPIDTEKPAHLSEDIVFFVFSKFPRLTS